MIEKLERGREFVYSGGQVIANAVEISKGITLWHIQPRSTKIFLSGDNNPPTSINVPGLISFSSKLM